MGLLTKSKQITRSPPIMLETLIANSFMVTEQPDPKLKIGVVGIFFKVRVFNIAATTFQQKCSHASDFRLSY